MTMRQRANYSLIALACLFILALILHWQLDQPWWAKALLFILGGMLIAAAGTEKLDGMGPIHSLLTF